MIRIMDGARIWLVDMYVHVTTVLFWIVGQINAKVSKHSYWTVFLKKKFKKSFKKVTDLVTHSLFLLL